MPVKATNFKVMLAAINQRKKPLTALSMFFSKSKTHPTSKIEFDVKVGKRLMAPFVSPYVGGVPVEKQGYSTQSVEIPKIAPEVVTNIHELEVVGFGEQEYQLKSVAQKQKELVAETLVDLDDRITRTEQWEMREVLLSKKVTIDGEGFKKEIKFDEDDKVTLSGTELWSHADANPLAKLKEIRSAILKATGKAPKIVMMDVDAQTAFLAHPKVRDAFDKRHIKLGSIEPRVKPDGTTFLGRLLELDMDLMSYEEWFIDSEGVEQPILPSGTVIVGNQDIGKMHYAAVKMFKNKVPVSIEAKRVPKHIVDEDSETEKMRLTSRPLPVPEDTKAWKVLDVL